MQLLQSSLRVFLLIGMAFWLASCLPKAEEEEVSVSAPATSWYEDWDDDGYGITSTEFVGDDPNGSGSGVNWVDKGGDCDDTKADVNPAESEIADLVDNNCKDGVDENFKYAFVTSSESWGNLGGLSGADQICDDLAAAAALPDGDYAAWLSSSTADAKDRVTAFDPLDTSTYVNTDGAIIANNFAGLIGGTLVNAIEFDEAGNSIGGFVWTSTDADGIKMTPNPVLACNDWAGEGVTFGAFYGGVTDTSSSWTIKGGPSACDHDKHHYCIQK